MTRLPFRASQIATDYSDLTSLPVAILLDNVRSMYNVGSFFRTMDAAGAGPLLLTGITPYPLPPISPKDPAASSKSGIRKTALGAEETVAWRHAQDAIPLLDELRNQGHQIAAIETSAHSVDLFQWTPSFPVCLVFGHEVDGIRPEVSERCDVHIRIPMLGRKHSLNVATAGGVALFELLRKYAVMKKER